MFMARSHGFCYSVAVVSKSAKFVTPEKQFRRRPMPQPTKKSNLPLTTFMVLFTIFGIPIIIALPFLIWGFIGRS